MWLATLMPFPLTAAFLVAVRCDAISTVVSLDSVAYRVMVILGTLMCAGAIALFAATLGTHRIPIPMWHQRDDHPTKLVTWGPYRWVRHPFYASYYLYFPASLLVAPTWPLACVVVYAILILNRTAAREEAELLSSPELGQEYARYIARTGRFFPARNAVFAGLGASPGTDHVALTDPR
jgi:protein-S-isoprenylcysteine O-methyltransferase Ste14